MKRALALILTLALLPNGALGEVALPEPEAEAPQMLLGEAEAEYFYEATLYYAASDGVSLSQATRTLLVQSAKRWWTWCSKPCSTPPAAWRRPASPRATRG